MSASIRDADAFDFIISTVTADLDWGASIASDAIEHLNAGKARYRLVLER